MNMDDEYGDEDDSDYDPDEEGNDVSDLYESKTDAICELTFTKEAIQGLETT